MHITVTVMEAHQEGERVSGPLQRLYLMTPQCLYERGSTHERETETVREIIHPETEVAYMKCFVYDTKHPYS